MTVPQNTMYNTTTAADDVWLCKYKFVDSVLGSFEHMHR